jgi:tRNA pseudouridine55 synthase
VNGFLNIDKPQGLTSRSVVDHINRLLRERGFARGSLPKVGHAGTLDPMATGVLVVAIGHATRLIELVQSRPKTYLGSFLFGKRSDTDDVAGQVIEGDAARASELTRAELDAALAGFRGRIEQVPPAFSAVRVAGRRAYKLARRGEAVEIPAKTVEVHRLDVVRFEPPELTLDIECGSGTYIRSLGRDLGERLGCGAVMSALVRTRIGPFEQSRAISISDFTAESVVSELLPCAVAASHLPAYVCEESEMASLSHGLSIVPRESAWQPANPGHPEAFAFVDSAGTLLAIGGWDHRWPELRPRLNLIAVRGVDAAANGS